MRIRALWFLVAVTAALVAAVPLVAAPIPGGTYGTMTWPNSLTYLDTSLCPRFSPIPTTPDGPKLHAVVSGWWGPVYDQRFQRVQLSAEVDGTITNAAGTSYRVTGHFTDNGVHSIPSDLRFEGSGTLVLAGRAGGLVVGLATLRAVTGPNELQLSYTQVAVCSIRSA